MSTTKNTKKRFTTKEQIVKKIDTFADRKRKKEKQVMELNLEAKTFRESSQKVGGNEELLAMARRKESASDKAGKAVIRLDLKLSKLRAALAEFQTIPISGIVPDNTVEGV